MLKDDQPCQRCCPQTTDPKSGIKICICPRGPRGPQGIQGPQGLPGPGSTYFFNQERGDLSIPPGVITYTPLIEVEVMTTAPGERVKIDSMFETIIITGLLDRYSYIEFFRLVREGPTGSFNILTDTVLVETNKVKISGDGSRITSFPSITWTDTPPNPGVNTYRIEMIRGSLDERNIASVTVQDRSITAIVFPPSP
ncbi:hypothetical protein J7I93_13675 [Bacillus sp. ISL-47]|uniref:hypothetical protein n=1 Tax=Bacillus sp. ISL-47 TaxID=2819130 RepID=UPI001BE5D42F|nr:hypothetical protein [Bacillus sp. ISL-47]MBT2689237.1 hypothetical protein [Bacillus sp. ISL-47]MBT2708641.1 hypothetical protein [Pseudomonas sp. ISL-84]